MRIIKNTLKSPFRCNRDSLAAFKSVEVDLRRHLLRERAHGRICWLDKADSLLGPGIRFKDGSFLVLGVRSHSRFYRRREPQPIKKLYPSLVMWQGKFLKLLFIHKKRRKHA